MVVTCITFMNCDLLCIDCIAIKVDSKASYNLVFTDLASGKVCNSDVIPASSCVDGACDYVFKVPLSSCPINTNIYITVGVSGSGFSKQMRIGL